MNSGMNPPNSAKKKIEEYYDDTRILYNLFWAEALHYGFWENGTRTLSAAVDNTNRFVAELLELHKNDHVLDAGCGVGGSSFFMAKKSGATITGITLSSQQLTQARRDAEKLHLGKSVRFEKMDFTRTRFKDATFTKIFSIEGTCYAPNKLAFLREAHRLLTNGGKITIVDGFLAKKHLSAREREIYDKCLRGWKGDNLAFKDDFTNDLRKVGFTNIRFYDKTEEVRPQADEWPFTATFFSPSRSS